MFQWLATSEHQVRRDPECFSLNCASTFSCTIWGTIPSKVMEADCFSQPCHVFFMAIVSAPPHFKSRAQCTLYPSPPYGPPYFTLDNINKTSFQWCRVQHHVGAVSSGVIKAFKHRHPLGLHMSALQSVFVRRLPVYMFRLPFAFANAARATRVLSPL